MPSPKDQCKPLGCPRQDEPVVPKRPQGSCCEGVPVTGEGATLPRPWRSFLGKAAKPPAMLLPSWTPSAMVDRPGSEGTLCKALLTSPYQHTHTHTRRHTSSLLEPVSCNGQAPGGKGHGEGCFLLPTSPKASKCCRKTGCSVSGSFPIRRNP